VNVKTTGRYEALTVPGTGCRTTHPRVGLAWYRRCACLDTSLSPGLTAMPSVRMAIAGRDAACVARSAGVKVRLRFSLADRRALGWTYDDNVRCELLVDLHGWAGRFCEVAMVRCPFAARRVCAVAFMMSMERWYVDEVCDRSSAWRADESA